MPIPKLDNETILLAFAVVTGLAVLLQAIFLLAITVAVRKAANSIREEAENLRTSIMPVIYDTRDLLANTQTGLASAQTSLASAQEFLVNVLGLYTRVAPKVEAATTDLVQITQGLRQQTAEMQASATEILERVRRQSNRLDEMFTNLLNTADRAGGFVVESVSRPVQQVSSMLRSVKAIIETLRKPLAPRRPTLPPAGQD
jgi:methyl-accepting chemotaxis protein